MATPQSESGSIQKIYTLTVYVAAAGTPLLDREGDAIGSSRVGHVYYSINDGQNERGYGFSPIESGMAGPGHVVRDEFEVYKAPAYSRTMEINEAQYSALKDYGEKDWKGISNTSIFNTTALPIVASTSPGVG